MFERELEFRGIRADHLAMYFQELGGKRKTDCFPVTFCGQGWKASIIGEEEITFTAVFKVNAVYIRFEAETESLLEELIKNYRYKTTRIGG